MSQTPEQHPHTNEGTAQTPAASSLSPRAVAMGAGVVFGIALVLVGLGIARQRHEHTVLAERTHALAAPTVSVATPKLGPPTSSLVLPGNVTAYSDAPIYARTSGYLTHWYYDIGAHVKKGALLATIASPEVDQQRAQAEADLATAQATANNARIQAQRYSNLIKSNAVSKQDTDTFANQATATSAAVRSAQANVNRLRQLQSFEKIYAPFDGIITARTIDTGQLIDQGTGKELFHLQAIQTLRVYVNLPQSYAAQAQHGMKVDLSFPEHVGKTYQATLVRTANALDPTSRTLLIELDLENKSGELLPGSLAQAHFKLANAASALVVPSAALIFRKDGLSVGTVAANGTAHLAHVVIGEDDGAQVQIVSGLSASDRVIQDPPDSLVEGQAVTIVAGGK
jgi:RND family efflux transporter MFP subunit